MASCENCGAELSAESRYCPECGHPAGGGGTKAMELPPDEAGRIPVHYTRAEPRYYGVTPSTLVLVLAAAALTLAIVLFATGHWPYGLILVGVSVLLVLVFLEAARRKPDGAVARSTAEALDAFRARAGVAADSLATRGRAARRVLALRRELQRMSLLRAQLLFELGDAVYRDDEEGTNQARGHVRELDALVAQREAKMQSVVAQAQERLRRRRFEVQRTEMVEPSPVVLPEAGPVEREAEEGR